MLSIVCVYNDKNLLDNYLLKSLKDQTVEYELIIIDNTDGKFSSAAEALNYGGKKAQNDLILFVHQDMDLSSKTWLYDVEKILKSVGNFGIAGVAGRSKEKVWAVTNIKDGIPPKDVAPEKIHEAVKVQTLDECLIIIPKKIFKILQFDEIVCDNWHLYAADYCLSVKKLGYDAYVVPLYAYHRSKAYPTSGEYYTTLKKLLQKHAHNHKYILLIDDWVTFYPLSLQRSIPFIRNLIVYFLRRM